VIGAAYTVVAIRSNLVEDACGRPVLYSWASCLALPSLAEAKGDSVTINTWRCNDGQQ